MSQLQRDFGRDLDNEQADSRLPEVVRLVKALFPEATGMRLAKRDTQIQRVGIDVEIMLPLGVVTADFKFRSPERDYDDFCLEWLHVYDDGTQTLGWVCDPTKLATFVIYIRKKTWSGWVLPFPELRGVWDVNAPIWKKKYTTRTTQNKTWVTHWTTVPIDVLQQCMGQLRHARLVT